MTSLRLACMCSVPFLFTSCAEDWDYFWNGPANGTHTPVYQHTPYTPSGITTPSYSDVESQDQKMRNYRQQLDRNIQNAVY